MACRAVALVVGHVRACVVEFHLPWVARMPLVACRTLVTGRPLRGMALQPLTHVKSHRQQVKVLRFYSIACAAFLERLLLLRVLPLGLLGLLFLQPMLIHLLHMRLLQWCC